MLKELDKSDQARRMMLLSQTGMTITEERLDPIWNWLEGISKNDPKRAELLSRSALGLEDGVFNPNRPLNITSIAYLTEHFPRLASLFDSYLISNFNRTFAENGRNPEKRKELIAYVQRVATATLEKAGSGFADRVASLAVVLHTPYENMSSDQKEMVSQQIANLLSQVWANRTTTYAAEWTGTGPGPNSLLWESKRKKMCVPNFLGSLSRFMSSIKWDKRPPVVLSAIAELEDIARPDAMTAWTELPTELQGTLPSEFHFSGYDFRLEEKHLNQLPSTLSPERKEQIDQLSVAYMLHRYASYLLWGNDPRNNLSTRDNLSPDEIGMQLSAFRKQDTNQDWLLSEDEWTSDFKGRFPRQTKPIGILTFVDMSPFAPQKCVNESHFRGAKGDNNKFTA